MTMNTTYDYPASGRYNETTATINGRQYTVDLQYAVVIPHGSHPATCELETRMGGTCTCGMLEGIDVAALVADARAHGITGQRSMPQPTVDHPTSDMIEDRGLVCPKCESYCFGDCDMD